jgi:ABC-type sugar transport system ATPase subunit
MLVVESLCVPPLVQNFSLIAPRGAVICLAGQVGSGAIEVVRAGAGLA